MILTLCRYNFYYLLLLLLLFLVILNENLDACISSFIVFNLPQFSLDYHIIWWLFFSFVDFISFK